MPPTYRRIGIEMVHGYILVQKGEISSQTTCDGIMLSHTRLVTPLIIANLNCAKEPRQSDGIPDPAYEEEE